MLNIDPIYIDAIWLAAAFLCGLAMKTIGMPTLLGFLIAGFALNIFGVVEGNLKYVLSALSDLGVTLLLFTIGLKIRIKTLVRKEILLTTSIHMVVITLFFSGLLFLMSFTSISFLTELSWKTILMISFALSFSSTVFVIKTLEERGEVTSRHGKLAIGILIIQDIFAVLFITATSDKIPSIWVLMLPIYLVAVQFVLSKLLSRAGHGDLLTIFGFFAPLIAGAFVFDLVNLKYDLGALIIGMLLVNHKKTDELYNRMMNFKDFFLIGFFINIGLTGTPTWSMFLIAAFLVIFIFLKGFFFNIIMSVFDLRARTNFLTSISLSNYSEFGLIVGAIGLSLGYLTEDWLLIIALTMTLSFFISAPFNKKAYAIYDHYRKFLTKINRTSKEIDKQPAIAKGVCYIVVGLGSIGESAFKNLHQKFGDKVMGIDYDSEKVNQYATLGYNVV